MGTTDGTVSIQNAQQVNGWYAIKILWITDPHRERTLIRGRQLDGPHEVRSDSDSGRIVPKLRIARWGNCERLGLGPPSFHGASPEDRLLRLAGHGGISAPSSCSRPSPESDLLG